MNSGVEGIPAVHGREDVKPRTSPTTGTEASSAGDVGCCGGGGEELPIGCAVPGLCGDALGDAMAATTGSCRGVGHEPFHRAGVAGRAAVPTLGAARELPSTRFTRDDGHASTATPARGGAAPVLRPLWSARVERAVDSAGA